MSILQIALWRDRLLMLAYADYPRIAPAQAPLMLETPRLRLRRWLRRDEAPFAAINLDPKVMAYFPAMLTPIQTHAAIEKFEENFDSYGYSFWAVELRDTLQFIGSIGLEPYFGAAVATGAVAIGWQLASKYWDKGLAFEAAQAVLDDAAARLKLEEVIAVTHEANQRSVRLCTRLKMNCDGGREVEAANGPATHPLRRQLVFRQRLVKK